LDSGATLNIQFAGMKSRGNSPLVKHTLINQR